jgi:hypothetical protein
VAQVVRRRPKTVAKLIELQASGVTSLNGLAAALNERGVPTPAGSHHWHAAQVSRLLKRLAGGLSEAGGASRLMFF